MASMRSVLVVATLCACGPSTGGEGTTTPGGGGGGGSGSKPAQAGDVALELNGKSFDIKGVIYEPTALGRPGMPSAPPKGRATIEKQRKVYEAAKDPVLKQAHAVGLASLYYEDSKKQTGDAQKKLVADARQVLRDAATFAGDDKLDETTIQFLSAYEMYLEDYAAAAKWFGMLVAKANPKDKMLPGYRAWWTFALLKQGKNTEALDAVKNETLSEKEPELAYAAAWAKFRMNDDAGAWQAIVVAAKGWQGNRQNLDSEVLLFASRSNVGFATVMPQLLAVFNAKQPAQQYEVLARLGLEAYHAAGRWPEAVAALDKALAVIGKAVPANDVHLIRYQQADFTVRLDDPEAAAKFAKQAVEALPGCGTKCSDKEKQATVLAVATMGRLFHILYATANDVRYYQPANDLYLLVIPLIMDSAKRTEVNGDAQTLQRTLKNTKVGTGTHDKGAMEVLLARHNQEVQNCYETTLAANQKLGGTLTLTLESDQTGAVKGVATQPPAGLADLSAVAGCVADAAKTWKLPKRGMAGSTRIKIAYQLSPKVMASPTTTAATKP